MIVNFPPAHAGPHHMGCTGSSIGIGCIVCHRQRDADRCGDRQKGADQYVTINGRLAHVGTQRLQSINYSLKGAGRTKNLAFAFVTYRHTWMTNCADRCRFGFSNEWQWTTVWPVDVGLCAYQAGSNCESQPAYGAHTHPRWMEREDLSRSVRHARCDVVTRSSASRKWNNNEINHKQWGGKRGGGKKQASPPALFLLVPPGDQRWAELSPAPFVMLMLRVPDRGSHTHCWPRTAARVRDGGGRVWLRETGERRRRQHMSTVRSRYWNVSTEVTTEARKRSNRPKENSVNPIGVFPVCAFLRVGLFITSL